MPLFTAARRWAIGLLAGLAAAAALAQTAPDAITNAMLEAPGPYALRTTSVAPSSAPGYGGGTVYHPSAPGRYGAIAIAPGFAAPQSSIAFWGQRLASHGFVVVTIDTLSRYDQAPSRSQQLVAALRHLVALSSRTAHPLSGKVDGARLALAGHGLGGAGALIAARDHAPMLKAALPMAPGGATSAVASGVRVPTLLLACEQDTVDEASLYLALPNTVTKELVELAGLNGACPVQATPARDRLLGRHAVAWMKRFVDGDTRYDRFVCSQVHRSEMLNEPAVSDYRDNCSTPGW